MNHLRAWTRSYIGLGCKLVSPRRGRCLGDGATTTTRESLLTSSVLGSTVQRQYSLFSAQNISRHFQISLQINNFITPPLPSLAVRTASTWPTPEEFKEWQYLKLMHDRGPRPRRKRRHPTDSKPQMKGIVLKTLIKKPKKPNSANRKCVLVRLSNGREAVAYIPGIGHNLQEHSQVLVHHRRVQDVPGLRLKVIRGALDCAHVLKQTRS